MSSLPWPPESDRAEAERWASESQWDVPPRVWAREATPEEVELLRAALDAHRRALDREAERVMDLLVLVAMACVGTGVVLGFLIRMAVEP